MFYSIHYRHFDSSVVFIWLSYITIFIMIMIIIIIIIIIVKLDLQYNELTTIPHNILELPNLTELNLSSNKLKELPKIPKWTSTLTVLDLSHNKLTEIPGNPIAPCIHTLNLADNEFHTVPQCVCSFVTLQSLDLSDNKDILSLPAQMGSLRELTNLNLRGLKDLKYPPKNVQKGARDCSTYLQSKLLSAYIIIYRGSIIIR